MQLKIPYLLRYVPDQHKKKMCDKAVDTYRSTIKSVRECYKTQEMCHRAVHRYFFEFDSIPLIYIALVNMWLKKCMLKLLMIFKQN